MVDQLRTAAGRRPIGSAVADRRGNLTVMTSLAFTILLGFVGLGVDVSSWYSVKRSMQTAVDSAAMAAAYELSRSSASVSAATISAKDAAARNGFKDGLVVRLVNGGSAIEASLTHPGSQFLSHLFLSTPPTLSVSAAARITRASICLLALEPTEEKSLLMKDDGAVVSPGCRIQVNSDHRDALTMEGNSRISALSVCVAGGVRGAQRISPSPDVDCPRAEDPLKDLEPPAFSPSNCKAKDLVISGTVTLEPGVYCSGLELNGKANVTLNPGIYVITDDKFSIKDDASLHGDDVMIYLHGKNALIEFDGTGKIMLKGPKSGPYTGVLVFQDRSAGSSNKHKFSKSIEKHYEGTIYLAPNLVEFTGRSVASTTSPYSIYIARQFEISSGATVTINEHYDQSDVPLPVGIDNGRSVALIR